MVIGSILRHFSTLEFETADGKQITLKNNPLIKVALSVIGAPHLGFRARARLVLHFLRGTPKTNRILDGGAGYGILALTLADQGYTIDALDLGPERMAALDARKKELPQFDKRIRTFVGSLTALPFADESYDTIICSEVIEHIADDAKAVAELSRVLKSGGTLILTVPYNSKNNKKIYPMFGHVRPGYTEKEMQDLLTPLGLVVKETAYYEYPFGSLLFKVHNALTSPALMAAAFYPLYIPYLLEALVGVGEPNGIGFKILKPAL
jgi:2-polyprenyl-3-methyl-5-hydroxy-6-metoxy-1,4-benzoquinol methylase